MLSLRLRPSEERSINKYKLTINMSIYGRDINHYIVLYITFSSNYYYESSVPSLVLSKCQLFVSDHCSSALCIYVCIYTTTINAILLPFIRGVGRGLQGGGPILACHAVGPHHLTPNWQLHT